MEGEAPGAPWDKAMQWSQIAERVEGDVVILDVQGRMTFSTDQGRLIHTIQRLLEGGRSKIVLNLAALPHLDSSGLSEIIDGQNAARRVNANVKLCCVSPRITELLTVTKLIDVLQVYDSELEAVRGFHGHVVK
jgi:anti-sigma B factor antagonist